MQVQKHPLFRDYSYKSCGGSNLIIGSPFGFKPALPTKKRLW
jgi:hypothetical protein